MLNPEVVGYELDKNNFCNNVISDDEFEKHLNRLPYYNSFTQVAENFLSLCQAFGERADSLLSAQKQTREGLRDLTGVLVPSTSTRIRYLSENMSDQLSAPVEKLVRCSDGHKHLAKIGEALKAVTPDLIRSVKLVSAEEQDSARIIKEGEVNKPPAKKIAAKYAKVGFALAVVPSYLFSYTFSPSSSVLISTLLGCGGAIMYPFGIRATGGAFIGMTVESSRNKRIDRHNTDSTQRFRQTKANFKTSAHFMRDGVKPDDVEAAKVKSITSITKLFKSVARFNEFIDKHDLQNIEPISPSSRASRSLTPLPSLFATKSSFSGMVTL